MQFPFLDIPRQFRLPVCLLSSFDHFLAWDTEALTTYLNSDINVFADPLFIGELYQLTELANP